MYANRKYVREIIKRVRFDEVREQKGKYLADKYGKQEATMYWDMLSLMIDEEYDHIVELEQQKRRA